MDVVKHQKMYQKNIWVMFAFVTVHNSNLEIRIKYKIMSSECENRLGYEDMNSVFVAGLLVINAIKNTMQGDVDNLIIDKLSIYSK